MTDALTIISSALKTVQKLREITQKIKDAETLNLIADLNLSLSDLKLQIVELREENLSLQEEIKKFKNQITTIENLEHRDNLYYFKQDQQNRSKGPYCTRCFDVNQLLVLVTPLSDDFDFAGKYTCPHCKAIF